MNHALFGSADKTERLLELAEPPFLLIDDGEIADAFSERFPTAKLFDVFEHSFNPLQRLDHKRARDISEALYAAFPQGGDTLTVRNGKRALTRLLLEAKSFEALPKGAKDPGIVEAIATLDDVLFSPVLERVLCGKPNFAWKTARRNPWNVIAKLDRSKLGDFDAFILAQLLLVHFTGNIIIPDFGFYGRDHHASLIRQDRLTFGVEFLSDLSPKLQRLALSVKDKTIYRTIQDDAERLVFYTKHIEPKNLTGLTGDEFLTS